MEAVFVEFNDIKDTIKIGDEEITIEQFFEDIEITDNTIWNTYDDYMVKDDILYEVEDQLKKNSYNKEEKDIFKKLKKDIKKSDVESGPFFAMFDFNVKCFEIVYKEFLKENKIKERAKFHWGD